MSNDPREVSSQQEMLPPQEPAVSDSISSQPKKSNKKTWMIIGIVAAILLLCSIICIALFGAGMYKVYKEKAPVESVLDTYMQRMLDKDAESSFALFSPRAQRQMSISQLQEMFEGNNYLLYEGYQSLSISNIYISAAANTNPDLPQGTVAEVDGIIMYEGDIQGSFNGVLEKVDDEWMLYNITVTVPPEKFN
jgi:hypothetical protein